MLPILLLLEIKGILVIWIIPIILAKILHVAQGKNTNNAVVSSRKYKGLRGFCPRKN